MFSCKMTYLPFTYLQHTVTYSLKPIKFVKFLTLDLFYE